MNLKKIYITIPNTHELLSLDVISLCTNIPLNLVMKVRLLYVGNILSNNFRLYFSMC